MMRFGFLTSKTVACHLCGLTTFFHTTSTDSVGYTPQELYKSCNDIGLDSKLAV